MPDSLTSNELVGKLREAAECIRATRVTIGPSANGSLYDAAANEIERLRCEVEQFVLTLRKIRAADEPADATGWKARYEEEYAIVDRIWKQLGIQTYEQAGGRSIHEIIADRLSQPPTDALRTARLEWALGCNCLCHACVTLHNRLQHLCGDAPTKTATDDFKRKTIEQMNEITGDGRQVEKKEAPYPVLFHDGRADETSGGRDA